MFSKRRAQILVVGAGPVGLFAACRLADLGIEVHVVDKHRRTGIHSYALALHPKTLRLLAQMGLTTELLDRGHKVDRIAFYGGTERRAEIDMSKLGGPYPFALVVPQQELEGVLERRLAQSNVKVQWNHRVQEVNEKEDVVDCEVAKLDQAPAGYPIARLEWVISKILHWNSSFVIGADGFHSMTRTRLGIDYTSIGPKRTFGVYEFESPVEPGNELRVITGPQGLAALWPMKGMRSRWSFQIDDAAGHDPSLDGLNRCIAERVPWFPAVQGDVHWSTVVEFDRRLAESLGRGRTWLAGDSVHLTSPVGVQSLNGGLVDAWDLSGRLATILSESGSADLLQEYADSRRNEWRALLGEKGALSTTEETDSWIAEHAETILSSVPATGEDLTGLLESIGLSFDPAAIQRV